MNTTDRAKAVARRGERRIAERRKDREVCANNGNGMIVFSVPGTPEWRFDRRHSDRRSASPAAVQADAITRLEQAAKAVLADIDALEAAWAPVMDRAAKIIGSEYRNPGVVDVAFDFLEREIDRLRQVIAEHRDALEPCGGCEECEETARAKERQ